MRFHLKTGATWFIKGGLCNSCYAPLNILFATPSNQTRYQREKSQMRIWNNLEYNSDTKKYRKQKIFIIHEIDKNQSLVLKRDINLFRYAVKKKNDIIWEFFPNVGPPHPPPPFWEPLIQKKNLVFILHFRT